MTAYASWFGPITAQVDIAALVDKQWAALLLTHITGNQYLGKGQPNAGKWGEAKALRDQIKEAL